MQRMKIGVFTCWCGVGRSQELGVRKKCSEPGQQLIHQKIKHNHALTMIVFAVAIAWLSATINEVKR
jgi:heterodisulfide reductase subunit A-like polyferredoxin